MARRGKAASGHSQLRIIGGQWRGRKLRFVPEQGLRPTTDRIRETLFNWLAPDIHGARCADLFAGSGALGLEALSRGAARCDFVDTSPGTLQQLRNHLAALDALDRGHCHPGPAERFLATACGEYDLVFIDPPFGQALVDQTCRHLANSGLLAPGATIYIETAAGEAAPVVPENWIEHRAKKAGGVSYRLFSVN
jgi:16S rRNA (guanine966-N2)-methyltransferase